MAIKGRGTSARPTPRFESLTRGPPEADDWGDPGLDPSEPPPDPDATGCGDHPPASARNTDGTHTTATEVAAQGGSGRPPAAPRRPRTVITIEPMRSIISRNRSPDIFFEQSINPYRGCEHGCIYCYARPNHAYVGLSPGLDFETQIFARPDAPHLLRQALSRPGYRCSPIQIGSVTDPYQPAERQARITRALLEVLDACDHPLTLITKSSLIERDTDILRRLASRSLTEVCITLTTLDAALARILEPRATTPLRRLESVRRLARAGIPVAISVGPLIPFINDHEIEQIARVAAEAGARGMHATVIRLPLEVAPLFEEWLDTHFPDRAARVMNRIRDLRGGRANDPRFGSRMTGEGPWAELIAQRLARVRRQFNLTDGFPRLDTARFVSPGPAGRLRTLDLGCLPASAPPPNRADNLQRSGRAPDPVPQSRAVARPAAPPDALPESGTPSQPSLF